MAALSTPHEPGPLIGRDPELATIEDWLERARLVTIAGLGGIGKTSVARELGDRWAKAGKPSFFVDLGPVGDPEGAVRAIAAAVGAGEATDRELVEAIGQDLAEGSSLLVLDNFEHVIDARDIVGVFLEVAPDARLLVTSRVRLGLPGEVVIALETLAVPALPGDVESAPASVLFLQRARERGRLGVVETDDVPAIVEICRRLDGLPLAIELAAAWTRIFLPRAILRRLIEGDLDLSGGSDPRHSSLTGVIQATLDLVGAHERETFAALGIFAGDFDEGAAREVVGDERVVHALRGLEAVALVQVSADPEGEPRFRLLETIRAVAMSHLSDTGRLAELERRHAAHYADRAVAAADAVRTSSFSERRAGAALADPNIETAFERAVELGESELAVRLAAALASYGMQTGIFRSALARLRIALAMPGVSAGVRADGLNALVSLRGALLDVSDLATDAREALALARAAGSPERVVRTLITLGNWSGADPTPEYSEAAALAEEIGYTWGAATAWDSLANAHWEAGRYEDALVATIRGQDASERQGDRAAVGAAFTRRGEYELNLGRTAAGLEHLEEAAAILRVTPGLPFFVTWTLTSLAAGQALADRFEDAYGTLAEVADRVRASESNGEVEDWLDAATTVLQPRHPVAAARSLGAVDRLVEETSIRRSNERLREGAARRIEHAIGRHRLETERAAGRAADPRDLFERLSRIVRVEAGPDPAAFPAPHGSLTVREREILAFLAEGRTDREIAAELGISSKTSSVHVANLKAKLGVETRIEAVIFARERLGGRD
jgi:predicted ATPase/DNA-binding CsgD family transcriptional regulator